MKTKQKGSWTEGDAKIALNVNDDSCYENAPVIEIPKEDFDFYMQIFEKYETDKKKRYAVQKRYFENNKKTYYERQKKWRDGHKLDLNAKRRAKYAKGKMPTNPDEGVPSLDSPVQEQVQVQVEVEVPVPVEQEF